MSVELTEAEPVSKQLSHDEKEEIFLQENEGFCFHDTASAVIVLCDGDKSQPFHLYFLHLWITITCFSGA